MTIGVTGSESICKIIKEVLERRMPDLDVIYMVSQNYRDSVEHVKQMQQSSINGIIFTGPTNYNYTLKRLEPNIPWTYIPHNQASVLKALLEAFVRYSCIPDVISLDMYEEELVAATMREAGIHDCQILSIDSLSIENPGFENILLSFHRYNYHQMHAKICFTNIESIHRSLLNENIPCIRILTTEDIIMKQIYYLQLQNLVSHENQGRIAVVQIYFDFSFDQEMDLKVREWEKIQYQNEMRELIYSTAHRMGAACFCEGASVYYMITNRLILMNQFIENGEYQKLLSKGQNTPHNRIWIGIGMGDTAMDAKSRAAMALNHSIADKSGSFYLAENDQQVKNLELQNEQDHSSYLLHHLHLKSSSFSKLKGVIRKYEQGITSAQLAKELSITERSANRLILRLEQENCVTTVGKISQGKGRPARIIKIILP